MPPIVRPLSPRAASRVLFLEGRYGRTLAAQRGADFFPVTVGIEF